MKYRASYVFTFLKTFCAPPCIWKVPKTFLVKLLIFKVGFVATDVTKCHMLQLFVFYELVIKNRHVKLYIFMKLHNLTIIISYI